MVIYGESIEEILKRNEGLTENQPIIGVGVEVVTKPFNSDTPFFYKTDIKRLYKKDLDDFYLSEYKKDGNKLKKYILATKSSAKGAIRQFRGSSREDVFVEVLEGDMHMTKLINIDTIQEVRAFIFDPQANPWKDMDFYVDLC